MNKTTLHRKLGFALAVLLASAPGMAQSPSAQPSLAQPPAAQPPAAQQATAAGYWYGDIVTPGGSLGIKVYLKSTADAWSGTIDIPVQGLNGFALSNVAVDGDTVHFEMVGLPGEPTFDGVLSADGAGGHGLAGAFTQGPHTMTFSLERGEAPAPTPLSKPAVEAIPGEGLIGEWGGTLDAGPMKLRQALRVLDDGAGQPEAILYSLDQDAKIAVDSISLAEGRVRMTLPSIRATYVGVMNADGSVIDGTWSQMGRDMPLTFHRLAERLVLERPQTPVAPFPYESRDVSFPNPYAGITLAGTLVVPDGAGPFPAVVMITGSGPQDRDESLMGHKPFWIIADHLARHGVASLRYDDRGFAASTGDHLGSTVVDFTEDAAAALDFLVKQAKIDPQALGVVGHSEGGLTGPRLAANDQRLDFLVLLAPPGEPLDALLGRQTRDILRSRGVDPELIDRSTADQREELAMVLDRSLSRDELRQKLKARADSIGDSYSPAEQEELEITPASLESGTFMVTTPWFRSLLREDPAVHLREVRIPVLALFAENDLQVAAEINAEALSAALKEAKNDDVEVHILPGLNHLFQHSDTGSPEEYGELTETFAPHALDMISGWIEKRFAAKRLPQDDPKIQAASPS